MKNSLLAVLALAMMFTIGCGGNVAQAPIAPGTRPQAVAVGDFNGDGKLDLAVANSGSNSVRHPSRQRRRHFHPQLFASNRG